MRVLKSQILRECTHHEISLLGVPEMYRVKLAFLAGLRFALETTGQRIVDATHRRYGEQPPEFKYPAEYYKAKALLEEIKLATTELHLDMRSAFGEPGAERFMNATAKLASDFAPEQPQRAQAVDRNAGEQEVPTAGPAETQQQNSTQQSNRSDSEKCRCAWCLFREALATGFERQKGRAASSKSA